MSETSTAATGQQLAASLPAAHRRVLTAALRAPSAHNAQPWRIRLGTGRRYELHYDHHDYLPADPEDRDAYLCMGAFCETLALAAAGEGLVADLDLVLRRTGTDLHVADVELRPGAVADPLAAAVAHRATNRSRYTDEPLPAELTGALRELRCVLVPTGQVARIVRRASVLSWRDRRFVGDLAAWIRADSDAPDGMSPRQLGLARYEWLALRAAFVLGRLPAPLARAYSGRDIRLLGEAPAVAVLCADSDSPADLVEAGRRLLRAWTTICAHRFGYHPISIAIDCPTTRPDVAALAGGHGTPVALFRIGRPTGSAGESNRHQLADVLRS
ncbi:MAG: hypothetical protein QOE23_1380 [Pseudonocardiales bacterium]|jgi:hypothetical protein|nr:hypothetical protein [Pseudonocardiales bacterium]